MTSSIPISAATFSAVLLLSPVIITVWIPRDFRLMTARLASGLTVSDTPINPTDVPSFATARTVSPFSASLNPASVNSLEGSVLSLMNDRLPTRIVELSTEAEMPRPGVALMPDAFVISTLRTVASARTATASGCSDPDSAAAASPINSISVTPNALTLVITGFPLVSVPVLSNTTVSIL